MSLVVSDISSYGIIMVGDSAITRKHNGAKTYHGGCVKIQFSENARIGFGIWGCADVGALRMDQWLKNFIADDVHKGDCIVDVGELLASKLNSELLRTDKNYFRRGIHLAGFIGKTPVLYHVHSGHNHEAPHEMRLYRDYPDNIPKSFEDFDEEISSGALCQLRNGRLEQFVVLFSHIQEYARSLKTILNTQFPPPELKGRLEFYKMLVRFVAGVLKISKQDGSVNEDLSWVAFDRYGSLYENYVSFSVEPKDTCGSALEC